MKRAKSLGIDAFALNIGVDPYTDQQLQLAYDSAANNGMKVFISFDFNWWHTDQATAIGQKVAQYASKPAQLIVDNKVFVSSFAGDGVNVATLRAAVGRPIFFAPNFHPSYGTDISPVDGLLNWMAWPNNGNNKAPTPGHNVSVADGDNVYVNALAGKAYIARESSKIFLVNCSCLLLSKNQPCLRGSLPILDRKCPTAKIGTSHPTCYGSIDGMRSLRSSHGSLK